MKTKQKSPRMTDTQCVNQLRHDYVLNLQMCAHWVISDEKKKPKKRKGDPPEGIYWRVLSKDLIEGFVEAKTAEKAVCKTLTLLKKRKLLYD